MPDIDIHAPKGNPNFGKNLWLFDATNTRFLGTFDTLLDIAVEALFFDLPNCCVVSGFEPIINKTLQNKINPRDLLAALPLEDYIASTRNY